MCKSVQLYVALGCKQLLVNEACKDQILHPGNRSNMHAYTRREGKEVRAALTQVSGPDMLSSAIAESSPPNSSWDNLSVRIMYSKR